MTREEARERGTGPCGTAGRRKDAPFEPRGTLKLTRAHTVHVSTALFEGPDHHLGDSPKECTGYTGVQ
jgi:hypothetical protein